MASAGSLGTVLRFSLCDPRQENGALPWQDANVQRNWLFKKIKPNQSISRETHSGIRNSMRNYGARKICSTTYLPLLLAMYLSMRNLIRFLTTRIVTVFMRTSLLRRSSTKNSHSFSEFHDAKGLCSRTTLAIRKSTSSVKENDLTFLVEYTLGKNITQWDTSQTTKVLQA